MREGPVEGEGGKRETSVELPDSLGRGGGGEEEQKQTLPPHYTIRGNKCCVTQGWHVTLLTKGVCVLRMCAERRGCQTFHSGVSS